MTWPWPRTAAGRGLLAWACALGLWLFVGTVSVSGSTWASRGISLGLAVGFAGVLSLIVRWAFRKNTARPFPSVGLGGWMARRPPWLAGLAASLALIIPVGTISGTFIARNHGHVPSEMAWGLSGQVIVAAGMGAFWAVVWQRQRHRVTADRTHRSRSVTGPE